LFQGQELQVENNLNLYLFDLRVYDPIIARWLQVDPFDEYSSSYLAMGNNPLKYIDPTGGETEGPQGPESNKDVDRSKNDEQSKAKPRERKGIIGLISSLIDPSWVKKSDGNYVKTLEHKGNLNQPSVTVNVENSITISQEQVPITDKTISYRAKYDPGNNTKELKMKVNSSYRMRDFEVSRGNENIYSNSNALREFDTPKIKHKRSKTYSISYKVRYLPYDNTGAAMGVVLLRTTLTVQRKIKINRALLQYSGMKKVGPISN
jgi:RHS repeat-associated protein